MEGTRALSAGTHHVLSYRLRGLKSVLQGAVPCHGCCPVLKLPTCRRAVYSQARCLCGKNLKEPSTLDKENVLFLALLLSSADDFSGSHSRRCHGAMGITGLFHHPSYVHLRPEHYIIQNSLSQTVSPFKSLFWGCHIKWGQLLATRRMIFCLQCSCLVP